MPTLDEPSYLPLQLNPMEVVQHEIKKELNQKREL